MMCSAGLQNPHNVSIAFLCGRAVYCLARLAYKLWTRLRRANREEPPRMLVIVRHDNRAVLVALRRFRDVVFAALDRRRGSDRRQGASGYAAERRKTERRALNIDGDLLRFGSALVVVFKDPASLSAGEKR